MKAQHTHEKMHGMEQLDEKKKLSSSERAHERERVKLTVIITGEQTKLKKLECSRAMLKKTCFHLHFPPSAASLLSTFFQFLDHHRSTAS
jgi:hypothetical protein